MGFRFRKSKNLGNFRLNLSKSGIGYSYGVKGFRRTHKAGGGTRTTMSIPGTGISHVTETGKQKKKRGAFVWIIMIAFLPLTLLVLFLKSDKIKMPKKKRYLAVAITMVAIVILAAIAGATSPGEEPEPSPDVREIQSEEIPSAEPESKKITKPKKSAPPSVSEEKKADELTEKPSEPVPEDSSGSDGETTPEVQKFEAFETQEEPGDRSIQQEEPAPVESEPKTQEPDVKTQEPDAKPQEPDAKPQEQEEICGGYVFVSTSGDGSRYHLENCRTIRNSETAKLTIAEAESRGFTPCGVCHPK